MPNRLHALEAYGQAVWLDFLDRSFLAEGGFARLIEDDGLTGVTSNPSIFEKAIGHGHAYDEQIAALVRHGESSVTRIYEQLAITDIQAAADALRPVYDRLNGADGFASIEVSPFLAGSSGLRFRAFLPWSLLGTLVWASAFTLVGYAFSESFSQATGALTHGAFALALVAAVLLAVRAHRRAAHSN